MGLRTLKPRRRLSAGKLEEPINLTFMWLDCGRNLECPRKTHADTATSKQECNQTSGLCEALPLQRRATLHTFKSRCMKSTQTSEHPCYCSSRMDPCLSCKRSDLGHQTALLISFGFQALKDVFVQRRQRRGSLSLPEGNGVPLAVSLCLLRALG